MLVFTNSDEKKSPTIIGAGCTIKGDIEIKNHSIQIHGTVYGVVTAETVIVGRGGCVTGEIHANNLFLHGTVTGPAVVNNAHIFRNARMTGKLSFHKLNITGNEFLECQLEKRKEETPEITKELPTQPVEIPDDTIEIITPEHEIKSEIITETTQIDKAEEIIDTDTTDTKTEGTQNETQNFYRF